MFELKNYQNETLRVLGEYLREARRKNPAEAFENSLKRQGRPAAGYNLHGLYNLPYVCLRLPTGGGKTVLASYAIREAAEKYLEHDYPLVLWLVPTITIAKQTLECLNKPWHPYRQAIDKYFKGKVSVFAIGDVINIRPSDLQQKVCVVVGTLATLRVQDKTGRRIYAHNENFEPHFSRVTNPKSGLDMREDEPDKIKYSFANLCALMNPLIIMDEAHNARTTLTFETLKRVHPACIIEFTATPNTTRENGSNVLYSVSASELKAARMIKLPIMLSEHQSWASAVSAAILTKNKLSESARRENEYIRPIVLFQAESKDRDITVEVLEKYLVENENIQREKIAIATGNQRELDGINLFDPNCKIEYIITIEALKEGWDCSFAYVFCSVAKIKSSTEVEQILGRVLRMPYAHERKSAELNKAYAHVSESLFSQAAQNLRDSLVDMGFEKLEADSYVQPSQQTTIFSDDEKAITEYYPVPLSVEIGNTFDISKLDEKLKNIVSLTEVEGKMMLNVKAVITDDIEKNILQTIPEKERGNIKEAIAHHRQMQQAQNSPAFRGVTFQVPQLCLWSEGQLLPADQELFLESVRWNPCDYSTELSEADFKISDQANNFEVDIKGDKVTYSIARENLQLDLTNTTTEWSEDAFIQWLDNKVHQQDIPQIQMIEFLRKITANLLNKRKYTMAMLDMAKYSLCDSIKEKIQKNRKDAIKKGFQTTLFGTCASVETSFDFSYNLDPNCYPGKNIYNGPFQFQKHYYPVISDIKYESEEYSCALAIERNPNVKHWVRNIPKHPESSFSLPTGSDRFYPDFLAYLNDGRILVVEYKGSHIEDASDALEKNNVGLLWETKSNGRCLFLMAVKKDHQNRDVSEQIKAKIG